MREHPILFSGPMVRALLAGTKTQTRRAWREQPPPGVRVAYVPGETRSPYGQPGDRLWVREGWRTVAVADPMPPRELTPAHRVWYEADAPHQLGFGKLRPGMFMPRWASRITLKVEAIRVERLQDISETDAIAEGCPREDREVNMLVGAREMYRRLWEGINGYGSWEANPLVWVVEFRRLA